MSPSVSARLLATQSDERLLELVGKGYERAFEAIVLRYRRPLLSYCSRIGLRDGHAEDVLQQAFLRAWLALRAGSEVRELRPWLYRIVHNTALNAIRSSPERRVAAADVSLLALAEPGFEQRLAAREALTDVAALPPMQREAILMSAVDGRSHEEVAGALGISSGAVRGLLYRARATLRSAAAAITPAPLLRWASAGGRVSPGSGLAQLSGSSADLGPTVAKGAALAVSAALAAGAVLAPLQHHKAARRTAARELAAASGAAPRALAFGGGPAPVLRSPEVAPHPASGGQLPRGTALALATPVRPLAGSGRGGSAPPSVPAPSATPQRPRGTGGSGGAPGTDPAGGASARAAAEPPPAGAAAPEQPASGTTGSGTSGGSTGGPTGGETTGPAGTESEEAREARERQAEEARERQEQEAEEAREAKEREAEKEVGDN